MEADYQNFSYMPRARNKYPYSSNATPSRKDSRPQSPQSFTQFFNYFRFVPTPSEKCSPIIMKKKVSSFAKVISSQSISKPTTAHSYGRTTTSTGSPVSLDIQARENTLDLQISQSLPTKTLHSFIGPSKKAVTPSVSRKGSPRIIFKIGGLKSDSHSLEKTPTMPKKVLVKKKNIIKHKSLDFSEYLKITQTLPDSRLNTKDSNMTISQIKFTEAEPEPEVIKRRPAQEDLNGLKNTMNLFRTFYSSHLFEPEEKCEAKRNLGIKVRPLFSKEDTQGRQDSEKNLNVKGASVLANKVNMSPDSKPRIERIPNLEQLINNSLDKTTNTKGGTHDNTVNEIHDSENLRKMIELKGKLKEGEPLNPKEKNFLRLIKEGADIYDINYILRDYRELVNIKDNRRETPLHWAVKKDQLEIVKLLCKYGADLNAIDIASRKPIDIAKRQGNEKIMQYLENMMA